MKEFYKHIYNKSPKPTLALLAVSLVVAGLSITNLILNGSATGLIVEAVLLTIYHIAFYIDYKKDKKDEE